MKTVGIIFVVVAVIAAGVGFVHATGEGIFEQSFESLYEETIAEQTRSDGRPDPRYVAKFGDYYQTAKDKRLFTRNVSLGIAAVFFVTGFIALISRPRESAT